MFSVYLITNKLNDKVYVGKTTSSLATRWIQHCSKAKKKSNLHFHNAIRKYGKQAFDMQSIACPENEQSMNNLEKVYVILFQANNPKFGYNSTSGGEGSFHNDATKKKISMALVGKPGHPMSEYNRLRLREVLTGKPKSVEHRLKISDARKNLSDEARINIGNARRGKNHTDESKQKMSLARIGKNNARYRHDVSNDVVVKLYASGKSLREVATELNIGMTTVKRRLINAGVESRPACIHINKIAS